MKKITTNDLEKKLKTPKKDECFVDVRSRKEFEANHIPGFENYPLESLAEASKKLEGKTVYVSCRSGGRAEAAALLLLKQGKVKDAVCYEESLLGWEKAGKKTEKSGKPCRVVPVARQAYLVIGTMLIIFSFLGSFGWGFILFMAGMMILSGITGVCPMHEVLKSCPWNKDG